QGTTSVSLLPRPALLVFEANIMPLRPPLARLELSLAHTSFHISRKQAAKTLLLRPSIPSSYLVVCVSITTEDIKFREYLESRGWDISQLGLMKGESV